MISFSDPLTAQQLRIPVQKLTKLACCVFDFPSAEPGLYFEMYLSCRNRLHYWYIASRVGIGAGGVECCVVYGLNIWRRVTCFSTFPAWIFHVRGSCGLLQSRFQDFVFLLLQRGERSRGAEGPSSLTEPSSSPKRCWFQSGRGGARRVLSPPPLGVFPRFFWSRAPFSCLAPGGITCDSSLHTYRKAAACTWHTSSISALCTYICGFSMWLEMH